MMRASPLQSPSQRRIGTSLAVAAAVIGVALLATSFVISPITIARASWTADDAREYQRRGLAAKSAALRQAHQEEISAEEVARAKSEYAASRAKLDSAARRGDFRILVLRGAGLASVLCAVFVYSLLLRRE